ncbi:MAG: transcription termination/antitermination protein NusG [Rickettsiales bacterium]|jgi:transcriptional antiterminator NusG|nr:transcription termination/antitermination protein NusG [Rickettsiales bacterium]
MSGQIAVKYAVDTKPEARWYVVYVHSGCEKAVVTRLEEKIRKLKAEDKFEEILIPSQEAVELKHGKKVKVDKKVFPGYVLIRMIMNNETWHMVRDIPLVSGFLGSHMKPTPISEKEAANLIHRLENTEENTFALDITYETGEQVKVTEGPFASFNGVIEKVDAEKQRVSVSVSIFGRPTQVDLSYSQVEKI